MQAPDTLPFHPVAIKFGILNGAEFDALVSDIKTNKQKTPIVMHNGMIIDGIQRYRACLKAKVKPIFTEYDGEERDIVKFIASMNMHRRHLSTKHKKEIALELLKADPTISDLAISKTTRLSDKTITQVRADAVRRSEIPNVTVRSDTKGREQPAKKCKDGKSRKLPTKTKPATPEHSRTVVAASASQTMPGDIGPMVSEPPKQETNCGSVRCANHRHRLAMENLALKDENAQLKAENTKLLEQTARVDGCIAKEPPHFGLESSPISN